MGEAEKSNTQCFAAAMTPGCKIAVLVKIRTEQAITQEMSRSSRTLNITTVVAPLQRVYPAP